jgi:putative Ca2+/H+ antiporter (TMEM165/GDT1 family)
VTCPSWPPPTSPPATHAPLSVGVGAVLGLWAVGALAITGGRQLPRVVPLKWITRTAAAVMTVLAVVSLVTAITG